MLLSSLINGFFHHLCYLLLLFSFLLTTTASSSPSSFIYVGCSPIKYTPNSPYSSKLNSLLTSLLTSSSSSYYNNFTTPTPTSTIYAQFQCRPDLPNCPTCISTAITQLTTILCTNSIAASIQLDGCYLRYDNTTFLGIEDKSVVVSKCAPNSAAESYGDVVSVMNGLMVVNGQQREEVYFRVRQSGDVRGVAMCVGDLNVNQCQDCLKDAVQMVKNGCGMASSGDVFLVKCYARFFVGGARAGGGGQGSGNGGESIRDSETQKTLAILIGIIAAVALLVIFLAFLRKLCEGKGGK